MLQTHKRLKVDMLGGSLIKNILLFAVPLMLTGILQLLYNSADMIVVGQFAEAGSIGAVGSTSPIINLVVNTFISLSIGSTVVVANYYGAGDNRGIERAVHTSITVAFLSGVVVAVAGFFCSRSILIAVGSPSDIIDRSDIYMKIFFLGSPFNLIYNFGSAILRAVGDTKRPLYYLAISGLINVALNLILVIVFHLGVAGVAIATVISQIASSIMVLVCLMRSDGAIKLRFKRLRIHKREALQIARIGIPAGIQSALFSFSNVIIQSSVNSFGSQVVEGNATGSSLDSFVYISMNSVSQAAISFVSQNYGAKQHKRIPKIMYCCMLVVLGVSALIGGIIYLFKNPLIGIYLNNPSKQAVDIINLRLAVWMLTYFGCGFQEVLAGTMRGLNYSITPMIVSLLGACVFRVIWIYTVFAIFPTMLCLYISYPISWGLTSIAHYICFKVAYSKLKRREAAQLSAAE